MNLPGFLGAGFAYFSAMPAWELLLLKATLILILAWPIHFVLSRANPRWRVFLWRGAIVGLVMASVWGFGLPGVRIRVAAPGLVVRSDSPGPRPAFDQQYSPLYSRPVVHSGEKNRAIEEAAAARPDGVEDNSVASRVNGFSWPAISWQTIVAIVWGVGVLLLAARLAIGHFRLSRELKSMQAAPETIMAEGRRIAAALGCRRAVRICSSTRFAVPFLYGVWRPVMVLPDRMCATVFSLQLRGILAHELAHTRSRDTFWNMLVTTVSTLLWFHPLAWRMGSVHRAACDAVCDAVSASYLGDVRDYCRTLARVALYAAEPAASAGLAMARRADVRRRLAMLERGVFSLPLNRRVVVPAAIVAISILTLVAGLRFALAETPPKANEPQAAASAEKKDQGVEKPSDDKAKEDQKAASDASIRPGYRAMKVQVRQADGKPLSGAGITVRGGKGGTYFGPFRYKTNTEGVAVIDAPKEGATDYQILAYKTGYVTQGTHWPRGSHQGSAVANVTLPEEFSFSLDEGTILGGIVRDEQGRPISGAEVTVDGRQSEGDEVRSMSVNDTVKTDVEGKWASSRVPENLEGFELSISVKHPDFSGPVRLEEKELIIADLRAQAAVTVMPKGIVVEGTVTTYDGRPAKGATVGIFDPARISNDFPRTKSDDAGHYRVAVLGPGEYTVAATAGGFVPGFKDITLGNDRQQVDIQIGKGEAIRLRIVDQDGKPLPGVYVSFLIGGEKNSGLLFLEPGDVYKKPTDAEGRWSRLWIPKDELRFSIHEEGYASVQKSFAPGGKEHVITLEPGVWSVAGRVVDAETKKPVTKFRVTEGTAHVGWDQVIWYESRGVENANGEYRMAWDSADVRRVIRIEADGYLPSDAKTLPQDGKKAEFNFELKPGQNITGIVRSPDGKPLAGAEVALCTATRGLYLRNGRPMPGQPHLMVRTGADGRFSFAPQNEQFVLVAMDERGFALVTDRAAMGDITLKPWAKVEGTLTIDGKPGAREQIKIDFGDLWTRQPDELSPTERAASRIFNDYEAQTDADGRFVFERMRPGKATISQAVKLSQEGGMSSWTSANHKSIELVAGETLRVDIKGSDPAAVRQQRLEEDEQREGTAAEYKAQETAMGDAVKAALKVLSAGGPATEEDRIGATLAIVLNGADNDTKTWASAMRDLIEIGKPAVPKLIEELDKADNHRKLSCLGFALRGIGDPRAVPALIRASARLAGTSCSDCGFTIEGDQKLLKFMQEHDDEEVLQKHIAKYFKAPREESAIFFFGRPINEIMPALEKITGESHEWMDNSFADSVGCGTEQERLKKIVFLNHAKVWADWWSKNWRQFVTNEGEAQLDMTRKALEECSQAIAKMPGHKLSAVPVGKNVRVGEESDNTMVQSFDEFPLMAFMDLDTGRYPMPRDELLRSSAGGEPSKELLAWAEGMGVDLIVVKTKQPDSDKSFCALKPLGMKVWRIDNSLFENLENALRSADKLDLPPWNGLIAQIDEKTGGYDEKLTVSFVFITKEGICGAIQIRPPFGGMPASGQVASRDQGGWQLRFICDDHVGQ
jgi:beta-lactamase regulating signal transducer with metallopeptidase domain